MPGTTGHGQHAPTGPHTPATGGETGGSERLPAKRRKETTAGRPSSTYVGFARRTVRGLGRRIVAEADVESLADLKELHTLIDEVLGETVHALREQYGSDRASWAKIGAALGIAKQTAMRDLNGPRYNHREEGTAP